MSEGRVFDSLLASAPQDPGNAHGSQCILLLVACERKRMQTRRLPEILPPSQGGRGRQGGDVRVRAAAQPGVQPSPRVRGQGPGESVGSRVQSSSLQCPASLFSAPNASTSVDYNSDFAIHSALVLSAGPRRLQHAPDALGGLGGAHEGAHGLPPSLRDAPRSAVRRTAPK